MPHFWMPLKANPHPWDQKKHTVRQKIADHGAQERGFYCARANQVQGYVLVEHAGNVNALARAIGAEPGDVIELDEVS